MRYSHDYRPGLAVWRCDLCKYERVGERGRLAVLSHELEAHAPKATSVRESALLGADGRPALVEVPEEAVRVAAQEVVRYEFNRRSVVPAVEEEDANE